MKRVQVRAPSNIAIVKYMGKAGAGNLPANSSLSMTLNHLATWLELEWTPATSGGIQWIWEKRAPVGPEPKLNLEIPQLSPAGLEKWIRHAERVLSLSNSPHASGTVRFRSGNSFPTASGIASSASSFAALTLAVATLFSKDPQAFREEWNTSQKLREKWAKISREGSGSSCRSMSGPWVKWESGSNAGGGEILETHPSMHKWVDLVLVVGRTPKTVSSSEAHMRVMQSPLWNGRIERANLRVKALENDLREGAAAALKKIAQDELFEMHSLFHTSQPPFTYWLPESLKVLQWWLNRGEKAPVITMDAGPNLHILVPENEAQRWKANIREAFPEIEILEDRAGLGAEIEVIE